MYIIPRFEQYLAVFLDQGKFYQPGAMAGPSHAGTAGGDVARAMRGAEQVLAKSIEKLSIHPIKLQGAMGAPVEIGMRDAIEADRKRRSHFAMTTHNKTHAAPAFN
ncbi:MAG: hypothetical protein NUV55_01690 [Sulfuricaulis sp.]|nr:hypothetical protein [Sulfuricaulis sp.]MCR4345908.1 hypothetical protein [Sulfuricaulis sp.]